MPFINECFEWHGLRNNKGYGVKVMRRFGNKHLTHRLAYAWANGMWNKDGPKIPKGKNVIHKCDNPSCCNPLHLMLGTQADNMQDCSDKGRLFNQRKTHCKRGHKLSGENLYITVVGSRSCKACQKYRHKLWRERQKD